MPFDDYEMLQGARRWDMSALEKIYDTYSPRLYRYAWRLLGDVQIAEDCVSITFERFLRALQSGRGPNAHLQAYLYRIAHNWVTDHYRRIQPVISSLDDVELKDDRPLPEADVEDRYEEAKVRAILRELPPDQRLVITLKYLEGWDNEQIAVTLKRSIGAVKAMQHRAVTTLRKKMAVSEAINENE